MRYEFYKGRGITLAVTTTSDHREDGFQDAWQFARGEAHSVGVRPSLLRRLTLITEKEARRRAPRLLQEWEEEDKRVRGRK